MNQNNLDNDIINYLMSLRQKCLDENTRIENLDSVFKAITVLFAMRGTCKEGRHGAVFVKDGRIIASGYNGSVSGDPHCIDVGCLKNEVPEGMAEKDKAHAGKCQRVIHGETNALYFAAKRGISTEGATCYVTKIPCIHCARALIQAGISKVIYLEESRSSSESFELLKKHGLI